MGTNTTHREIMKKTPWLFPFGTLTEHEQNTAVIDYSRKTWHLKVNLYSFFEGKLMGFIGELVTL